MRKRDSSFTRCTNEELMREYQLGEAEAFEELYRRCGPRVNGFLRQKLGTEQEVQDVFQDTFLRLHRYRHKYDATHSFLPWLFTLCHSALVDHYRKLSTVSASAIRPTTSADHLEGIPSDAFPQPAGGDEQMESWLEGLPERERQVLYLHYKAGFAFPEIAERLGLSAANARKLSSRAIGKLRTIFGQE